MPAQVMQQAVAAYGLRAWTHAERLCRAVLARQPNHFEALNLLGVIAAQLERTAEAADLLGRAVAANPRNAMAHCNHGNVLFALKRFDAALASYARAAKIAPNYAEAYNNRANALKELGRHEEALESYGRALKIKPDYAAAYNNRGNALLELRRDEEALDDYERALKIRPDYAEAYNNRGYLQTKLGRFEEALLSFARALELKPAYAEAYNNRGYLQGRLNRIEEARKSFEMALKCKPDYAEAHHNLGNAYVNLRAYESAIPHYDRALELKPDFPFLRGARRYARMQICDWRDIDAEDAAITAAVERGELVSTPFHVLSLSDRASLQRKATELFVAAEHPARGTLSKNPGQPAHVKIRIGYFSADFRNHAVSYLAAGVFEAHDRAAFELTAFSFGPDTQDDMRKRLEAAFDRFVDVRGKSDKDIVALARALEIDIAVDLGGFTQNSRPGIFAARAAPLQVSFLGYAGTMGAPYMDYLIADPMIVPADCRRFYTEKIIYLPNSFLPADSARAIAARPFTRVELGLPETSFVFCCFNNSYKIAPATFDGWMRILRQVEGSVLWLSVRHPHAASNLRQAAVERNVAAERLIFAPRMASPAEHLARHRAADLFLDTLPYNAHTTASDALWAGLPVLTCPGEAFASRVASSLVAAVGLPELIAATRAQYEELAIELAGDRVRLAELKGRLAERRGRAPLFDTALFTRHLERAYTAIHGRRAADLPTDHIVVSPAASACE